MRSVTSSALLRESRLVPAAHPRALSTVKSPDDRLFVSVNEYRPETPTSGVTLLLTHGTSFCKELWEPLIEFWLREGSPLRIAAVFALDAVNHGDSAVANEKQLGSSSKSLALCCSLNEPLRWRCRYNPMLENGTHRYPSLKRHLLFICVH